MKRTILFLQIAFFSVFCSISMSAQTLLPMPRVFKPAKGFWDKDKGSAMIVEKLTNNQHGDEEYQLHITKDSLIIRYATDEALLRAQQTIRQLTKDNKVQICDIHDWPEYEWRGFMLDVSRHIFSLDFLKKQVDLLSSYKINKLHLHLVDAGGWRLEIKKYPRLTQIAAWRTESDWTKWWIEGATDRSNGARQYTHEGEGYGGYYTQEQMKQLVTYAKQRGVEIIPEIEMPGHSEELMAVYPEIACRHAWNSNDSSLPVSGDVCPGNEGTYEILQNILDEVMEIFPSKYIHIGGDEAGMGAWKNCPLCQQKMKDIGIDNVYGLQTYLVNRMGLYLQSKGRQMIGWDEIIDDGIKASSTVMVWRNSEYSQKAIKKGCEVIMSPGSHCYFDNDNNAPDTTLNKGLGWLPLEKVYSFNPTSGLSAAEATMVKGVQANLWTEFVKDEQRCEELTWPRMLAIAEVGWNGEQKTPFADFRKRCLSEIQTLRAKGVNAFDINKERGERKEALQTYKHKAVGKKITLNRPFSKYYPAQGDNNLVDGRKGGWLNNDGIWQGFVATDSSLECLDAVIDLGKVQNISTISMEILQNTNSWIWYPKTLKYFVSADGQNYKEVYTHDEPYSTEQGTKYRFFNWKGKENVRFVRVMGTAQKEGGWIFADEIIIH